VISVPVQQERADHVIISVSIRFECIKRLVWSRVAMKGNDANLPVTFVVDRNDVKQDQVTSVRVDAAERNAYGGKHSSESGQEEHKRVSR
jgi:hypothetical protein